MRNLIQAIVLATALPLSALAQVSFTGIPLTENFDGMGPAGTTPPSGWSVQIGNGNDVPAGPQGAYTPTTALTVDNGSLAPNAAVMGYNYGATGNGNRSLGTACTGNSRCVDVAIRNDSGVTLPAFKIGYTGRKWRQGSAQVQIDRYNLYYSASGAANSWVALDSALTYSSPNALPNSSTRDGYTVFQAIGPADIAPPAPVAVGATFYIRFWDHNPGDTDGAIAVDDFSFEATVLQPVAITQQPVNVTVAEGSSATFTIVATESPTYQWYSNGVAVAGATASSFTVNPALRVADASTYYCVVANAAPSSLQSSTVTLTVIPDNTKPVFTCAYQGASASQIIVVFSEPVDGADIDTFDFDVTSSNGGSLPGVASVTYQGGGTRGNTIVVDLDSAMQDNKNYAFRYGGMLASQSIVDPYGNIMDNPVSVPVGRFPLDVLTIDPIHQWRYYDLGTDLGTTWKDPGYVDSAWSMGPALLGVETAALPEPLRTPFASYVNTRITYYFRTHVTYSGPSGTAILQLRTVLDDSAILYVNGVEAYRLRIPAGPVNYLTQGGGAAVGDAVYEGPVTICVPNMLNGDNVIAVEVHQIGGTSSDIVMGLEIKALLDSTTPPVNLTPLEPADVTLAQCKTLTLFGSFSASPTPTYQWLYEGSPIDGVANPSALTPTLTIPNVGPINSGHYQLHVVNAAGVGDSRSALVSITPDATPPHIVSVVAALSNANSFVVTFDEPVNGGAIDPFSIQFVSRNGLAPNLGLTAADAIQVNPTTVVVGAANPREPAVNYRMIVSSDANITDSCGGNPFVPVSLDVLTETTQLLVDYDNPEQIWRFNQLGMDLGTAWRTLGYVDSGVDWSNGPAFFGLEVDANFPGAPGSLRTPWELGAPEKTTFYLRNHFTLSAAQAQNIVGLVVSEIADDGAVTYVNGVEVSRNGFAPDVVVEYATLCASPAEPHVAVTNAFLVNNLVAGDNVIAVEVHQSATTSSDVLYGSKMAEILHTVYPNLSIVQAGNTATVSWPEYGLNGQLQTSGDLVNWVTDGRTPAHAGSTYSLTYTIPAGAGHLYIRLLP